MCRFLHPGFGHTCPHRRSWIVVLLVFAAGCGHEPPVGPAAFPVPAGAAKPIFDSPAPEMHGRAPDASEYDARVAIAWFDLATQLVQAERWTPPRASRAFGIAGVALYEALVPGMPGARSLAGQLNELGPPPAARGRAYHWPSVANAAMATTWAGLFADAAPATRLRIETLAQALSTSSGVPPGVQVRSVHHGEAVGEAILDWAAGDGFDTLHDCAYTPPTGPGLWEPTSPAFAAALEPCWGQMRPFVLSRANACDPGAPPEFDETADAPFMHEVREVYETSQHLTPEQITIARFWADGAGQTATPAGHSISIASQLLALQQARLDAAAETYARLGIAVADAFISCWWSKFHYNLLRPITCIRAAMDADWTPLLPTPPFPEYTSGHSAQSGAAAAVLTARFGRIAFTDHTHDARGFAPRHFDDFDAAASEAAISRLYGGIHYRSAIERGLEQGRCIGDRVGRLRLRSDTPDAPHAWGMISSRAATR